MKATPRMTVSKLTLTLLLAGGTAFTTFAQVGETANATLSGVQNGSLYDYILTLNNTGTVPVGTFWYAWIPGYFFLPSAPASVTVPTGWTYTTPSLSGNYSIEYAANSGYELGGGSSLQFGFSSTDTPTTLAGDASSLSGTPIGTSFVYEGGAFGDPGYQFVVESVPEPSALGLLTASCLCLASAWRRKLRRLSSKIG